MIIKVSRNQNLLDIALQHSGSAEAAYGIAMLNGISITGMLSVGQEVSVGDPLDPRIADYYAKNNILPASGVTVVIETPESSNTYVLDGYVLDGYVV